MKKLFALVIIFVGLTGCFKKAQEKGSSLYSFPEKLGFFIKNHVNHFHYPTLEAFTPKLLDVYYKNHPIHHHPAFASHDFSGDGQLDYAFMLPLENTSNILIIVNTIPHSVEENSNKDEAALRFRFYYIGLIETIEDDFLAVKDDVLMKHSLNGDAVEITWNEKAGNYQLSKPLN